MPDENQEWETRPIYDLVKIDLFKKSQITQLALTQFRQIRGSKNYKNFQDAVMLLFDTMRPHLLKRYKKLPQEIEWLDIIDLQPEGYVGPTRWLKAYKTLSQELMAMGVLNIHDTKDDPENEF